MTQANKAGLQQMGWGDDTGHRQGVATDGLGPWRSPRVLVLAAGCAPCWPRPWHLPKGLFWLLAVPPEGHAGESNACA